MTITLDRTGAVREDLRGASDFGFLLQELGRALSYDSFSPAPANWTITPIDGGIRLVCSSDYIDELIACAGLFPNHRVTVIDANATDMTVHITSR